MFLIGIDHVIDAMLLGMITKVQYDGDGQKEVGQAHILFVDTHGVGKTSLLNMVSRSISASMNFIQCNPQLMPNKLVGDEIYVPQLGKFFNVDGLLCANIVGLDEFSRLPPKTQSATLGAMEERFISVSHTSVEEGRIDSVKKRLHPVDDDDRVFFWVLATANPLDHAGTYPVAEAQLDRFAMSLKIGYPNRESELKVRLHNVYPAAALAEDGETIVVTERKRITERVTLTEILDIGDLVISSIPVSDQANELIQRLIDNSRPGTDNRDKFTDPALIKLVDDSVAEGMSTRSRFHFEALVRSRAFLDGARVAGTEHVRAVAPFVMPHRLILKPHMRATNTEPRDVMQKILDLTRTPC